MKAKKEGEIYSYMLRFNKGLERDQQALENITQFCKTTDMTMRDAILLIIATADISALHNSILSLNVVPKNQEKGYQNRQEKNPENQKESQQKRAEEKEHNRKEPFREALPEDRYIQESQEEKEIESSQEDSEKDVDLDSMIADIFNNF